MYLYFFKNVPALGLGLVSVEPEEEIATQLQHIILSYIPEKECREEVKPYNLGKSTICARHDLGAGDACRGDSGGPLFDEENQVIVGLTSYGDARCDSRNPGVYAKVSDNVSSYVVVSRGAVSSRATYHTCIFFLFWRTQKLTTLKLCGTSKLSVALDQRYHL